MASQHLNRALSTMAYHLTDAFSVDVPEGATVERCCGISADPDNPDALIVLVRYRIRASERHVDAVWDQCSVRVGAREHSRDQRDEEAFRSAGNRCGLREAIVEAYAPVIREAARLDALGEGPCIQEGFEAEAEAYRRKHAG